MWLIYLSGILVSFGLILSIIAHEMGHVIVCRKFGIDCSSIMIFMFGGAAVPTSNFQTAKSEFFVAIAGPMVSLFIAIMLAILIMPITILLDLNLISYIIAFMIFSNILFCVFNLIPAFPLDGGRILRSVIWAIKKDYIIATKYASYSGQFFGGCMIGYGITISIITSSINGIWIGIIGFIVMSSARQAYRRVSDV
jgi:Zn-dependent protease